MFQKIAKQVKQIDIEKISLKVISNNKEEIVDILTDDQEDRRGEDLNGNKFTPYRSDVYAAFKRRLNPNGVVDRHLTGSFHDKTTLNASKYPVTFDSSDQKSDMLQGKYGKLELNEESITMTNELIEDELIGTYQNQIVKAFQL